MQNGKQKPLISEKSVRSALEALIYTSTTREIALLRLLLVDEFLLNPDLPHSSRSREFALNHILTTLISTEYKRYITPEIPPLPSASREAMLADISRLSVHSKPELIGWGWLYYRYVCVNLNISPEEFAELNHIDERTLRRYQQHAVRQLTDHLINLEWKTRTSKRRRRLYTELPSMGTLSLQGRLAEKRHIHQVLKQSVPPHIQVIGAPGIGKTALVEFALQELIEGDQIHKIVWISNPLSPEYVWQYLTEQLLPSESRFSLREYLIMYPTVIVLDDLNLNDEVMVGFLQTLSKAIVMITSRRQLLLPQISSVILSELSETDAKLLINQALARANFSMSDQLLPNTLSTIWDAAGGNPLAINLYVANLRSLNAHIDMNIPLNVLLEKIFYGLSHHAQLAWCSMTLLPPGTYSTKTLQAIWPSISIPEVTNELAAAHVIHITVSQAPSSTIPETSCSIINPSRQYIEYAYSADATIHRMVNGLLRFDSDLHQLAVIEHVLCSEWIDIDLTQRVGWLREWWKEGIQQRHWSIWRALLEPYAWTEDLSLHVHEFLIGYGICLRGLGEWAGAYKALEQAVYELGRVGQFTEQAFALIELSVILRYQGEYSKSSMLLERARRFATNSRNSELLAYVSVEQAQISLDLKDMSAITQHISQLPPSLRGRILLSEIHLALGNISNSRAIAFRLLEDVNDSAITEARLYTLLGRGYEFENDFTQAHECFLQAITLLEQCDDVFGLARAQTNLGSVMLQTQELDEAEKLLSSAEKVQSVLNDQVGLSATKHNLRLLHIARNT